MNKFLFLDDIIVIERDILVNCFMAAVCLCKAII